MKETDELMQHRRSVLRDLIQEVSKGNATRFCQAKDLSIKSITAYLSEKEKRFGTRAARSLEEKLCLPEYYFDEGAPGFKKPIRLVMVPAMPTSVQPASSAPPSDLGAWVTMYIDATETQRGHLMAMASAITRKPEVAEAAAEVKP